MNPDTPDDIGNVFMDELDLGKLYYNNIETCQCLIYKWDVSMCII